MFLHTIQTSYEKMRGADVDADEATITDFRPSARVTDDADASTAWYPLNQESNGAEIIFYQEDATPNVNSTVQLWGRAVHNGPAELIAEISGTVGTANILNDTTALAWDTMNIIFDGLPVNIVASDSSGANRPARITFDTMGLKYLKPIWPDISSNGNNALIRVY